MARMRILITGAGRGLGLALCQNLLSGGHEVIATARRPELSKGLSNLGSKFRETCMILPMDVSSEESVTTAARSLGNLPLDRLINNAGIFGSEQNDFESLDMKRIQECFDVNTLGAMRVTQKFLPHLQRASNVKIAHITSQMGSIADNTRGGYYAYRISKAALNMFNKSFSVDYPDMVSLVLHPGWVRTEMGGPGANLEPEESASQLIQVIEKAGLQQNGMFLNYKGEILPW